MTSDPSLRRAVSGARNAFIAVAVFSLFTNVLTLTLPLFMMQMYDRVVPSRSLETLILLVGMAGLSLAVMAGIETVRGRIMVRFGLWLDRELSQPLLAATMRDVQRTGRSRGASTLRELATLRGFLTGPSIQPLLDSPWVPFFLALIFLLHPMLGLVALGGGVLIFGCSLANDLLTRKTLQKAGSAIGLGLYRADSAIRNADVVAAMGMAPAFAKRWAAANEGGHLLQAEASDRGADVAGVARFVRMMLQVLMLATGAWLVVRMELTGGAMMASSIILGKAMAPIEQSISAWRAFVQARSAWSTIKQTLDKPVANSQMSLPRPKGEVRVENVVFTPPGAQEPVLRGVAFGLRPGDSLGVIGASASGKTTLARLLVGSWFANSGHVRLDGADLAVWDATDRGRWVGYLPQDVELFDGSIRDNIARLTDAPPEQVIAAAELAGCHDLILRLPKGYDTVIGEGGVSLSGGQRQRIGLARALFGEPSLVVLDEPNANLDADGEQALVNTMAVLAQRQVTVVVIAHRPGLLRHVGKLLLLNQGRVELFGPRDEVLARMEANRRGTTVNQPPAQAGAQQPAPAASPTPAPAVAARNIRPLHPTPGAAAAGAAVPGAAPAGAAPPAGESGKVFLATGDAR